MKIYFASGNPFKQAEFAELRRLYAASHPGTCLERYTIEPETPSFVPEIQAESPMVVVDQKDKDTSLERHPLLCEDTWLDDEKRFVFGSEMKIALRKNGVAGVAEIFKQLGGRACETTAICARLPGIRIIAVATVAGSVCSPRKPEGAHGYDPIFVPDGFSVPYTEMEHLDKLLTCARGEAAFALFGFLDRYPGLLRGETVHNLEFDTMEDWKQPGAWVTPAPE